MRHQVYFIQETLTGPIKVGFTKNLRERKIVLQTASPTPLSVLKVINAPIEVEKAVQAKLQDYKILNEWFVNCPAVVSFIQGLPNRNKVEQLRYIREVELVGTDNLIAPNNERRLFENLKEQLLHVFTKAERNANNSGFADGMKFSCRVVDSVFKRYLSM